MKQYSEYVQRLENLLHITPEMRDTHVAYTAALNGEPSRELRKLINLEERRASGAFFTGSELAANALIGASKNARFCDPSCGAGDLLLAAARLLPICSTLKDTAAAWGEKLIGCDIHPEFVRATKIRLLLLAHTRGARKDRAIISLSKVFPHIQVDDGLKANHIYKKSNWILLNPPYVSTAAPCDCDWASGKVTSAALFLERAATAANPGTEITAILPDVLRTGSRYG